MIDHARPDSPDMAPQTPTPEPVTPKGRQVDVVVIGAGFSGASAAVLLGRAGYRVAVVDRYAVCPPQFRVESIADEQADALRRMDLLAPLVAVAALADHVFIAQAVMRAVAVVHHTAVAGVHDMVG